MITINVTKAKVIAHNIRRGLRTEEFKPYDDAIAKQLPNQLESAETARVAIRAKYAAMQTAIDSASTIDAIKAAMP
jgi:hypothetical protein